MPDPRPDEGELVRRLARRDEAACRELYRRHAPAMYASALRLLGGRRADADDALQEAWLRAVRGLGGFRGASAFRTWLIGIAIRVALEIGRRREPAAPVSPEDERALVTTPHLAIDLDVLVARLPAGYRRVLLLHDVEGYTHQEIAALLDIEPGTSKSQLSRARRLLRGWLTRGREACGHER